MKLTITIKRNGQIDYRASSFTDDPIGTAHEHLRNYEIAHIEEMGLDNYIATLPDVRDDEDDVELIEEENQ